MKKSFDIKRDHKVRVYFNGERQKDMYPNMTKFQYVIYRIKKFFKNLFIGLVVAGILFLVGTIAVNVFPKTVYKVQEKEVVLDNLTEVINKKKGELIKDIFDNERAGKTEDDALITWDPDPKRPSVEIASIGSCQWKVPTLQESYLKHYGKSLNRKEAILIALDDEKCKEVMTKVIFSEDNGWMKWYNSGKKVNASGRLAIIKDLESQLNK